MKKIGLYPYVNNLEKCKIGVAYCTDNYKMFKKITANRGSDTGIIKKRLTSFREKTEPENFFFGTLHVLLNCRHQVVDGTHKLESCAEKGILVNFMILNEPKFNVENEFEVACNVSDFNSGNQTWNPLESFGCARKHETKCALAIDSVQNTVCNNVGIKRSSLTPNRIFAFATSFKNGFNNRTVTTRSFNDDDLAKIIASSEFESLLTIVCEIMKLTKTFVTREWDFIIEIAKKHLSNPENKNILDCSIEFIYTLKAIQRNLPKYHMTKQTEIRNFINTL